MSVKIMAIVWEEMALSQGHLLVALALADNANDHGNCWPGVPLIAKKSRLTERRVQQVLADLKDWGYISIERRPNKSNIYQFLLYRFGRGEITSPQQPVDNSCEGEAGDTPNRTPISPLEVKPTSPRTINEPSREEEIYLFDGSSTLKGIEAKKESSLRSRIVNLSKTKKFGGSA